MHLFVELERVIVACRKKMPSRRPPIDQPLRFAGDHRASDAHTASCRCRPGSARHPFRRPSWAYRSIWNKEIYYPLTGRTVVRVNGRTDRTDRRLAPCRKRCTSRRQTSPAYRAWSPAPRCRLERRHRCPVRGRTSASARSGCGRRSLVPPRGRAPLRPADPREQRRCQPGISRCRVTVVALDAGAHREAVVAIPAGDLAAGPDAFILPTALTCIRFAGRTSGPASGTVPASEGRSPRSSPTASR